MTRINKEILFLLLLTGFACAGPRLWAQGTYTAASCNESDVQAAISNEQAHAADGDIISIPSGTCTWTGGSGISVTFNNSVTIQGAGAEYSTSGGSGTAGSDQTIIIDDLTYNGSPANGFLITTVSGKSFEFTGIYVEQNSSSTGPPNGFLRIQGSSTAVRIDHCHFYVYVGATLLYFGGAVLGVVDHCFFDTLSGLLTFNLAFHNGQNWNGDTGGHGDGSWADSEHFGTGEFFFAEDDRFHNGDVTDCHDGGRYVVRYCTMYTDATGDGQFFNHGLDNDRTRSARAAEVYQVTFTQPGTTGAGNPAYALNGGALLFWGNTITEYRYAVSVDYTAKDNGTYTYQSPPNGFGYCSTNTGDGWDQKAVSPSGYACLDQPGRGQGDMLEGSFPDACDETQGCPSYNGTWPREALVPAYIWDNTFTPSGGYSPAGLVLNSSTCATCSTTLLLDNQDYYQQFGTYGESGTFSGTKGVGQGLYSAIPSTCTAGPGGNTPGVGYWATDQNTLYVCNTTNTWTAYYTPYTYPHPLTQTVAPAAPTNVQAVAH